MMPIYLFVLVVIVIFLAMAIKILNEYERGVIFRLGRVLGKPKGPGLIILIPIIDRMVKVSLRTVVHDVPAAGRDHEGQRLHQGERRRLLPGYRPHEGNHRRGELPLRHEPAFPDDAAGACSARRSLTISSPTGRRSTRGSRRYSTCTPSRGASRCRTWR